MDEASPKTPAGEDFPAGLHQAYRFAVFNALSFQIILSSPMVLYAKTLEATGIDVLIPMFASFAEAEQAALA